MKKLKMKTKNFNKKKSAKIQKRKQKKKNKKSETITDISYEYTPHEIIVEKRDTPSNNISFGNKVLKVNFDKTDVRSNLRYPNMECAGYFTIILKHNRSTEMGNIFDSELNLLPKEKINMKFLGELFDVYMFWHNMKDTIIPLKENLYEELSNVLNDNDGIIETDIFRSYLTDDTLFVGYSPEEKFKNVVFYYLLQVFPVVLVKYKGEMITEKLTLADWTDDFGDFCNTIAARNKFF